MAFLEPLGYKMRETTSGTHRIWMLSCNGSTVYASKTEQGIVEYAQGLKQIMEDDEKEEADGRD
jgi:hypothetical protein